MRLALETYYPEAYPNHSRALPIVLRYRSWIGSDRDGNPNVTSSVTWKTLIEQRKTVLQLYLKKLDHLRRYLSISYKEATISDALRESLRKEEVITLYLIYTREGIKESLTEEKLLTSCST